MKVTPNFGVIPNLSPQTPAPIAKTIGTGIQALDLDALKASATKLGLIGGKQPAATHAAKNTAAFADNDLRFSAPDEASRAFAESAIAAMIAAASDRDTRKAKDGKSTAPTTEQQLLKLASKTAITHLRVVYGVDENLKGKSPAEVDERTRLSTAILAEMGKRLWNEVPYEKVLRDMPQVAQALLSPTTKAAQESMAGKVESAMQAQELRRLLGAVNKAADLGMTISPADQKLLTQADREADATPNKSYGMVVELIEQAKKVLKNPPPQKMSKAELAELKKAQKAGPPPTLEQMLAHADKRIVELTAEIAGAPAPSELQRFKGAMVGLAIGDALGGPTEFMSREELVAKHGKVTDMIGGGWLNLKPGEYTDDTQMAERMAQAIVHKKGFDLEEIGKEFVGWLNTDPKDVGGLTRESLELKRIGVPADQAGQIPWVMSGYENAGNGSVMRAAPVGLLTAFKSVDEIDTTARASSAITHADPRATYGTAAINYATALIIGGEPNVVDKVGAWLKDKNPVLSEAVLAVKDMNAEDLRTSGYSVHTVQAAFWALHHAKSYVDGVLTVSNLGEDTDTAGATAGILLGAKFGVEGIPQSWRSQLQNREGLEDLAVQIHALAKGEPSILS